MQILIVRHAIAMDKAAFAKRGKPDALRPLTKDGAKKMKKTARAIRKRIPDVDGLVSSPLVRAVQTADILSKQFEKAPRLVIGELSPGKNPANLLAWLKKQKKGKRFCLVGHEPHLSETMGFFLAGRRTSFVELKKGGAALLSFPHALSPGGAELSWLTPPRFLKN